MPTKEEIEELLDESKIKSEWKTNYQKIKGLNGREFTSKINGNSIFIPAAGFFDIFISFSCGLWVNSISSDDYNDAWYLHINSNNIYIDYNERYDSLSIRGVCS